MPNRNVVGDYRYNYQGQELDKETGKVAFQLRLYDPRINRWLTTDPASQYASPYLSMGNNWVNMIDPDGAKAFWKPDKNGNLIAEAGDNASTLATYLNISESDATKMLADQGYTANSKGILNLKIGDKLTLDNVFTQSILNSTSDFDTDKWLASKAAGRVLGTGPKPEDNYNCWGSACAGSQGNKIEVGVGIPSGSTFDTNLTTDYKPVIASGALFGETVLRFANSTNVVKHGAVFYGRSKNGDIYVYTKNGWHIKPEVMKLSDLTTKIPSYGTVQGILPANSGYFNPN